MKPGTKSSEYWVTILSGAIVMINNITGSAIDDSSTIIVAGLAAIYTLGRSIVKAFTSQDGGV